MKRPRRGRCLCVQTSPIKNSGQTYYRTKVTESQAGQKIFVKCSVLHFISLSRDKKTPCLPIDNCVLFCKRHTMAFGQSECTCLNIQNVPLL